MREECGVFGIYHPTDNVSHDIYYALTSMQHRGQEGCGICVNKDRVMYSHKHQGLVDEVFNERILKELEGNIGVGHVRYASASQNLAENVQPLLLRYIKGNIAIGHNGSLTNSDILRREYEQTGSIYQTTTDTELIAYTIARQRISSKSIEEAVIKSMKIIKGAYSVVMMSPEKLIAFRDPNGFRPLSIGEKDGAIMFASESCAFDALDARFVRDVEPGEVVVVKNGEIISHRDNVIDNSSLCIFEYIYFARPDSVIDGELVYDARKEAGRFLAKEYPVDADIVIGVPDSGIGAGIGYAIESGIPYENGFIKNRYVGRTFIKPNQKDREIAVRLKLNPIRSTIEGKKVIMVDDSIVRGTTCMRIVKLLREAGAKEVHVRISAPPFINPCFYGTDIPSRDELTAVNNTIEEIRQMIDADSLGFLSLEATRKIAPKSKCGFCDACFTGNYPVERETLQNI